LEKDDSMTRFPVGDRESKESEREDVIGISLGVIEANDSLLNDDDSRADVKEVFLDDEENSDEEDDVNGGDILEEESAIEETKKDNVTETIRMHGIQVIP
jgi:hypothetical protein